MHKKDFIRAVQYVLLGLSLLGFMWLNGCATHHRKDGPPSFYVDETKVPNAVPKVEPLSHLGNQPTYYVFGKKYHVMPSSRNYQEVGIASWYGTMFHSHHTSNGERYDMLSMTAAHKSLPLPTYLEVTNLKNHRTIIVRVNDRGPFEANRIIDLSYVAAKKLGMLGHGTALVKLKAIDPVRYAHQHQSPSFWGSFFAKNSVEPHQFIRNKKSGVYLQVGAFRKKTYALDLKKRLAALLSSPVDVSQSDRIYRVKIGPLENLAAEKRMIRKLHVYGLM
jgi:rare lipoprotein A